MLLTKGEPHLFQLQPAVAEHLMYLLAGAPGQQWRANSLIQATSFRMKGSLATDGIGRLSGNMIESKPHEKSIC